MRNTLAGARRVPLLTAIAVTVAGAAMAGAYASDGVGTTTGTDQAADEIAGEPIDIESLVAADEPPGFSDVMDAAEAFKAALVSNDLAALAKLLGLDASKLAADENTKQAFAEIRDAAARSILVQDVEGRKILKLGAKLWPFPFPLVKSDDGKWAFQTFDGLDEIVNRRIGENELEAIETLREYIDAQNEYASRDRDGDGVLEYAQKLISTEGQTDGLYWPADQGDGESPAGDFADQTALDEARKDEGYFGYRFRILKGQGDNIAGGAYDYVINGNMIAGFALLAWPVKYAETGVNTFAVSQHGIIYQIDLSAETDAIVKYIDRFDPDDSWAIFLDDRG